MTMTVTRAADLLARTDLASESRPSLVFVKAFRDPILLGGRYLKTKRMVPQSPWTVKGYGDDDEDADDRPVTTSVQVCSFK